MIFLSQLIRMCNREIVNIIRDGDFYDLHNTMPREYLNPKNILASGLSIKNPTDLDTLKYAINVFYGDGEDRYGNEDLILLRMVIDGFNRMDKSDEEEYIAKVLKILDYAEIITEYCYSEDRELALLLISLDIYPVIGCEHRFNFSAADGCSTYFNDREIMIEMFRKNMCLYSDIPHPMKDRETEHFFYLLLKKTKKLENINFKSL